MSTLGLAVIYNIAVLTVRIDLCGEAYKWDLDGLYYVNVKSVSMTDVWLNNGFIMQM